MLKLEFNTMTRILYVDGVRFEDLEPLERNKILGLLFKGGQERAALEAENNTLAERCEGLEVALEYEKTNTALLKTVLAIIVLVNIAAGYFIWLSI